MSSWTQTIDIIITLAAPLIVAWIGSVEYRLRKLHTIPTRDEVDKSIELHQRDIRAMQKEFKEDLQAIVVRLEKVADSLSK